MGSWSYGLLNPKHCIGDWKLCLLTYLFPSAVFGMAAEKVLSGGDGFRCYILASLPLINYLVLPCWRKFIREDKGVDGNILFDCIAAYCCTCCVLFQGAHEAGIDADHEFSKTVDLMKRGYNGFDPKKEMEKAKDQTKEQAVAVKETAEDAKNEATA